MQTHPLWPTLKRLGPDGREMLQPLLAPTLCFGEPMSGRLLLKTAKGGCGGDDQGSYVADIVEKIVDVCMPTKQADHVDTWRKLLLAAAQLACYIMYLPIVFEALDEELAEHPSLGPLVNNLDVYDLC